jgi:hypothetical protein
MLKKLLNKFFRKKEDPQFIAQKIDVEDSSLSLQEKIDNMLVGFYGEENLKSLKNFELKLSSNRVKYKGLSFETFNWTKVEENLKDNFIFWTCDDYPIAISLNYFDLVPDLPKEKNIDVIRNIYWENGVAILKSDFYETEGITCVENLFKTVYEDKKVQYSANITIPFEDRSFVLKVISEDYGDTGLRDATVYPLVCEGDLFDTSNMTIYPYDKNKKGRMTASEKEDYDYLLPFHHLTVLRKVIPLFLESISLEDELKNIKPFYK